MARGAVPLDLASRTGAFLPLMTRLAFGGESGLLLEGDLTPVPPLTIGGGGVLGFGGLFLGAEGNLDLDEVTAWVTGRRDEESLLGRMRGLLSMLPFFCC